MPGYSLSVPADDDLTEIFNYIAAYNSDAAKRIIEQITDRFAFLSSNPGAGHRCEDLQPEMRRSVVGKYVVYYKLVDGDVLVLRVLHGRRDAGAVFNLN